jgi:hypothetical protein
MGGRRYLPEGEKSLCTSMKDFGVELDFSHGLPFCSCGGREDSREEEDCEFIK